jgi:hypothetical protein
LKCIGRDEKLLEEGRDKSFKSQEYGHSAGLIFLLGIFDNEQGLRQVLPVNRHVTENPFNLAALKSAPHFLQLLLVLLFNLPQTGQ